MAMAELPGGTPAPASPEGGGDGGSGGGLGSILSALAMAYGVYQGSRNQDKQNAYNREAATTQFDRDKEMWNMLNEYNSPKSQMERYQQAGLNPNLIYGQGSPGNASSAPQYHVPQQSFAFNPAQQIMEAIPMYQSFQARSAQIDNVKAQTENIRSRTVNESLRGQLMDIQQQKGQLDLGTDYPIYGELKKYQLQTAAGEAGRQGIKLDKAIQEVKNMTTANQLQALQAMYAKENLNTQAIEQQKKSAELLFQKYRNAFMSQGVTSSDNVILRMMVQMATQAGLSPIGEGADVIQNILPQK